MKKHQEIGIIGEQLAQNFLIGEGYQILECNWRFSKAEIDIIAKKGEMLVFVEVKTRSSIHYGKPEEFITKHKENLILDAAFEYMQKINHQWEIRFDFISIHYKPNDKSKIDHFKDVFH